MLQINAAISADIVHSTSLSVESRRELMLGIRHSFLCWEKNALFPSFWGRVVKGDSVECLLSPREALRAALMLKSFVKSFHPKEDDEDKKFKCCGIRIAIGIGEMRIVDRGLDIMDGEAIYYSGRALANMKSSIRNSFQIISADKNRDTALQVMFSLLNYLINRGTRRQCEVLYHRLMNINEVSTAKEMGITRPAVNQNMNLIGWEAIKKALDYYEQIEWSCL